MINVTVVSHDHAIVGWRDCFTNLSQTVLLWRMTVASRLQLSRQRFVTVQADASSIFASIAGDPGEKVDLLAVNAAGHDVRVVCNVGDTGTAIMACDTAAGCSCQ